MGMRLYIKMLQAKQRFLDEERGAVDMVAIVVLIGIVVVLALVFRRNLEELMNNMFSQIEGNAISAVTP